MVTPIFAVNRPYLHAQHDPSAYMSCDPQQIVVHTVDRIDPADPMPHARISVVDGRPEKLVSQYVRCGYGDTNIHIHVAREIDPVGQALAYVLAVLVAASYCDQIPVALDGNPWPSITRDIYADMLSAIAADTDGLVVSPFAVDKPYGLPTGYYAGCEVYCLRILLDLLKCEQIVNLQKLGDFSYILPLASLI